ncbi:MAG TPA: hypothetical protein VFM88_08745 [Vicinamibacteria bacterium]|nr:hypothetical protein [Vicinamibacteria bacterium]
MSWFGEDVPQLPHLAGVDGVALEIEEALHAELGGSAETGIDSASAGCG